VPIYFMWREARARKAAGKTGFMEGIGSPSRHRIKSGS